jgi:hypothetical protein
MSQTLGSTIFELGEARGRRRVILQLGRRRWGEPPAGVQAWIEQITDLAQLDALALRLLDRASWQDILASV